MNSPVQLDVLSIIAPNLAILSLRYSFIGEVASNAPSQINFSQLKRLEFSICEVSSSFLTAILSHPHIAPTLVQFVLVGPSPELEKEVASLVWNKENSDGVTSRSPEIYCVDFLANSHRKAQRYPPTLERIPIEDDCISRFHLRV